MSDRPKSKWTVRPVAARDVDTVVRFDMECHSQEDPDFGVTCPSPSAWAREDWSAAVAEPRHEAILAEYNGGAGCMIGAALVFRREPERLLVLHMAHHATLDGPDSSARRRLLDHLEAKAATAGKERLTVEVHEHDIDLMKLLARWGFRPQLVPGLYGEADGYRYSKAVEARATV